MDILLVKRDYWQKSKFDSFHCVKFCICLHLHTQSNWSAKTIKTMHLVNPSFLYQNKTGKQKVHRGKYYSKVYSSFSSFSFITQMNGCFYFGIILFVPNSFGIIFIQDKVKKDQIKLSFI